LFYRLREAEACLERGLAQRLSEQAPRAIGGWPVRAVDAAVLNGPGQPRTGQPSVQGRAHVLIDPATGAFDRVELTDDSAGEKLARHALTKGELTLGDRAYGTARGLHARAPEKSFGS
jgi:hypothetical protein